MCIFVSVLCQSGVTVIGCVQIAIAISYHDHLGTYTVVLSIYYIYLSLTTLDLEAFFLTLKQAWLTFECTFGLHLAIP